MLSWDRLWAPSSFPTVLQVWRPGVLLRTIFMAGLSPAAPPSVRKPPGTRGGDPTRSSSPGAGGSLHLKAHPSAHLHGQGCLLTHSRSWLKGHKSPWIGHHKTNRETTSFASWWPLRYMSKTHFQLLTNILEKSGGVFFMGGHGRVWSPELGAWLPAFQTISPQWWKDRSFHFFFLPFFWTCMIKWSLLLFLCILINVISFVLVPSGCFSNKL